MWGFVFYDEVIRCLISTLKLCGNWDLFSPYVDKHLFTEAGLEGDTTLKTFDVTNC